MISISLLFRLCGRLRISALICALIWLGGCVFESVVPDEAEITCISDDQCPPDLFCNATLGLCVPGNQGDGAGPQLSGNPDISRVSAGLGQEITVRFHVNEPLIGPPRVFLMLENEQKPFGLFEEADTPDSAWAFRYVVDGSEPQGQVPVGVSMVGTDGAEVSGLFLGNLQFDFDAPRISDAEIFPQQASASEDIEITFMMDENVPAEQVRVWMQNEDITTDALAFTLSERVESPPGTSWKFRYSPDGQEPNGLYEIWIEGEDVAGNLRTTRLASLITLDFLGPNIIVPSQAEELSPIASGDELRVHLVLNEVAEPAPVVTARSLLFPDNVLVLEALQGNGEDWIYSGRFSTEMPEGIYEIFVSALRDEVGNSSADTLLYRIVLDNTPPAANLFSPTETSLQADATLEVTFVSSEPLGAPPRLNVGLYAMTRDPFVVEPAYRFTLPVAETDLSGTHYIEAVLEDPAKNIAVLRPGLMHVDQNAPVLVDAFFSPAFARRGSPVLFSLYLDEEIARDALTNQPQIDFIWRDERALPLEYLSSSGFSHTYRASIDESIQDGPYILEALRLIDEAGNQALRSTLDALDESPSVEVDTTPPQIEDITLNAFLRSAHEGHREVILSFRTDETLLTNAAVPGQAHLRVSVEGQEMPCEHLGENAYRCETQIDETHSPGAHWIRIFAQDGAGNVTLESASFEVDHTPPALIAESLSIELRGSDDLRVLDITKVQQNTRVRVAFLSSDELGDGTRVEAVGPGEQVILTFEEMGQTGNLYLFEYECDEGIPDGEYELKLTLVDTLGNRVTRLNTDRFIVVDNTPPSLVAAKLHRFPWGGSGRGKTPANLFITFDADALTESVTVIASDSGSAGTELGRGFFAVPASDDWLALSPVTTDRVLLVLVDEAGNESNERLILDVEWTARFTDAERNQGTNPHFAAATTSGTQSLSFTLDAESQFSRSLSGEFEFEDNTGDTISASPALSLRAGGPMMPQANKIQMNVPQTQNAQPAATAFDRHRGEVVFWNQDPGVPRHWKWRTDHWVEATNMDPESDGNPSGFNSVALAYDESRSRTVLMGFSDGQNQLWEHDGTSWERKFPTSSPAARSDFAFFSRGNDLVMFGGKPADPFAYPMPFNDLWSWDGTTWTELQENIVSEAPESLTNPTGVYDAKRGVIVIAGTTCDDWQVCDEPNALWEWSPSSGWQAINEPLGSTGTYSITSAWDPVRERSVFATWTANQMLPDFFAWDGQTLTPLQFNVPRIGYSGIGHSSHCYNPSQCTGTKAGSLEYDVNSDSMLLFMRQRSSDFLFGQTWEHTIWRLEPTGDTATSYIAQPVYPASMYTEARLIEPTSDKIRPAPGQIRDHAMVYDPAAQRTYLYGGGILGGSITGRSQEFWAWDGIRWSPAECGSIHEPADCKDSDQPEAFIAAAMAYDSMRELTWVFTAPETTVDPATGNDIYFAPAISQWDGVNRQWTTVRACSEIDWDWQCDSMTGLEPEAFEAHHVVYDSARDRLVMFVERKREIWELNPNNLRWKKYDWSPGLISSTEIRNVGVVYDPQRQCTVAVGRRTLGDTGNFSGASCWTPDDGWTPIGPGLQDSAALPPPVLNPRLVYVPHNGAIYRFGGEDPSYQNSDLLYELTQEDTWTPVRPPQLQGVHRWRDLAFPNGVYDAGRKRLVVHGFSRANNAPPHANLETWELDFAPTLPPAHTFRIDLNDVYRSENPVHGSHEVTVQSLTVRALSGARGHRSVDADLTHGVSLDFWNGERFVPQTQNSAPLDTPRELESTLDGWYVVTPYIHQREFNFRLRPDAMVSKPGMPAAVSTDFVEVRVEYQHPNPMYR